MDFSNRLSISYYKNITILNEEHQIYIAQHQLNKKIFVKKTLTIYNPDIYQELQTKQIEGIPKIIELYEEDSTLTVIEEYISGETLEEKINQGSLREQDIHCYITDLCNILIKLHHFNPPIIHRDIKPSNIIVTPYNRLFLLDYNAAKYLTSNKSSDTVLLGTKGYAAPEQYGFGFSTQQTDIYAMGILLKELAGSLHPTTNKFDDLIIKCTQINPADRFRSVEELCAKLPHNSKPTTHKEKPQPTSWSSFTPPGFRTHNIWRMMISLIGYAFIFALCFTLKVQDVTPLQLRIEQIFCLLMFLSIVFVGTNYRNIQSILPLCQSENRLIHFFGTILLDIILVSVLLITMALLVILV